VKVRDIKNFEDIIKNKLKEQGYFLRRQLGEPGAFGFVWLISKDKVLKITTDLRELETSSKLVDKDLKHVVKIYKAFKFSSMPRIGFIVQERLKPLKFTRDKVAAISKLRGTSTFISCQKIVKDFNLKDFKDIKKYIVSKEVGLDYDIEPEWGQIQSTLKNTKRQWNSLTPELRAFIASISFDSSAKFELVKKSLKVVDNNLALFSEIFESFEELYKNNIHYTDTHAGNLMQDAKGVLKWVDLGFYSSVPGKNKIERIQGAYNFWDEKTLNCSKDIKVLEIIE
jgi:hypothetical protein